MLPFILAPFIRGETNLRLAPLHAPPELSIVPASAHFKKLWFPVVFFFFALLPREPDDSCHSYDSVVEPTPIRKDFYYTRSVVVAEIHFFALFTFKKDDQKKKKKLC